MFLLDDLLIKLPATGLVNIFKKIYDMAEAELTDESVIKEDLMQLQMLYETDQVTEEEYQKKESALLERLNMAREAKSNSQ